MSLNRLLFAAGIAFAACACSPSNNKTASAAIVQCDTLTVMSYNVHNCKAMSGEFNIEKIAEVINRQSPDIVALQELDSMTLRHPKYVVSELAKLTNLKPIFFSTIDYSGGRYGIGMLSKNEPQSVRKHLLADSTETRGIIVADFENFTMGVTHLGLGANDRLKQIDFIHTLVHDCDKPFVLAGDFNFKPDSEAYDKLSQDFTPVSDITANTFPANEPTVTIDYIMIDKGSDFNVVDREVIDEPNASDHRPVVAKIVTGASR